MKNTFIIAMFIFWGFVIATISAGYIVKQNHVAQDEIQKTYTDSLTEISVKVNKGNQITRATNTNTQAVLPVVTPTKQTSPVVTKQPHVPVKTEPSVPVVKTGLTVADVSMHNTKSDCWVIISNKVYSVASYIPMHPGGADRILNVCGSDATSLFLGIKKGNGHSSYATSLLGQYLVGTLQ